MNRTLEAALASHHSLLCRDEALDVVATHVLDHAVATGQLTALFPGIYVKSCRVDDVDLRTRATLLYAGDTAVLSHLTALSRWGALPPACITEAGHIHVTVAERIRRRAQQHNAVIHRTREPVPSTIRGDLPVTRLERSIVDSWPLLAGPDQRAPAILAVAERRTTAQRLLDEAVGRPNLKGRASLIALCEALVSGCRSELELWGLRHVFHDDPRFAHGIRQLPVEIGPRTAYLDLAFVPERVAVELDGAAYHYGKDHRERDMRRDAALSALGWVVLRFSYQRLHLDPDGVRDEVAAVLQMRRRQLAA